MKTIRNRLVAVGAAAFVLAGLGGVATGDALGQSLKGRKAAQALAAKKPFRARGLRAAATYLGVTPKQLRQQLPGTSLAAIADATAGKSAAGLKQAILDALAARLDKAVTANRITADQKQARLTAASARVDKVLARVWPQPALKRLGKLVARAVVAETAKALELTRQQLREQTKGKSLSALLTEKGSSAATVKAAVLARFDARLDKLVAANRLTQTAAAAALAKLGERVDKVLARVRPA